MAVQDRIMKFEEKVREKEDRLERNIALQKERNNYDTKSTYTKVWSFLTCNNKKSEN